MKKKLSKKTKIEDIFFSLSSSTFPTTIMQFRAFAALSCLLALALVNTVDAAVDPVSLAVIVIAGVAIAKEKLIAAEIHRNYIRRPVDTGYGYKRG